MAADASINCLASRMICIEEIPSKKQDQSKDADIGLVRIARPPFQIGGISELCSRVSTTEPVFPTYKDLLVETNASDSVHAHTFPSQRCRNKKHANDKRLSQNLETHLREVPNKTQKVMGKPKLIELYQFSKVDESQQSGLPNGVSVLQILRRVTQAQPVLRSESKYKSYFEKVFYSSISQSILKDFFWWLYLDGWNPDQGLQEKLFERVSYNYVQLIILADHPYYAEPFLKSYPRLLSQSTYAAFCEAFSDSYSNFQHDFKEKLVNLANQWVTGLKPAARSWLEWNMDDLEPVEIRNRRNLLKTTTITPSTKPIDINEVEELEMNSSEKFRAVSFDLSKNQRKSFDLGKEQRKSFAFGKDQRKSFDLSKEQRKSLDLGKEQRKSLDLGKEQRKSLDLGKEQRKSLDLSKEQRKSLDLGKEQRKSLDLGKEQRKSFDLSKEKRKSLDLGKEQRKSLDLSKEQRKSLDLGKEQRKSLDLDKDQSRSTTLMGNSYEKVRKESHPLGKGPDFVQTSFLLNGKSPLVMHYLTRMNLQSESGMEAVVRRTELENLPPIDAPTYSDLIRDTFKSIRASQRSYKEFYDRCVKENQEFALSKKLDLRELRRREALLLSRPREVKRLSDIITLEFKLDKDSSSKATRQAIDSAVNSVK